MVWTEVTVIEYCTQVALLGGRWHPNDTKDTSDQVCAMTDHIRLVIARAGGWGEHVPISFLAKSKSQSTGPRSARGSKTSFGAQGEAGGGGYLPPNS